MTLEIIHHKTDYFALNRMLLHRIFLNWRDSFSDFVICHIDSPHFSGVVK